MAMPATQLYINRDIQGKYTSGSKMSHPVSNTIMSVTLTQNVIATFTVPGLASEVKYYAEYLIQPGSIVYIQQSASPTIAVPTGTPTLVAYELNPNCREIKGGTVIQMLTPDTAGASLTISFMQIPYN